MHRALLVVFLLAFALSAEALDNPAPTLWQERFFWDALLTARERLARQQSDPMMIPVMKSIALLVAQQGANLTQIHEYVKTQADGLRYAYAQVDPQSSLNTVLDNFETLTTACDQVRQNLYYLTARQRIAQSQALPDPEMYQAGLVILGQVQQLQLTLTAFIADTNAVRGIIMENNWSNDNNLRHKTEELVRSVMRIQDSVFTTYNSATELTLRCR